MAVAAGGKIEQVINQDNSGSDIWRKHTTVVFNVQLLNAACFQAVTGLSPPPTPISAETYKILGLPFFAMYEEPSDIHGDFAGVKSVAELEGQKEEYYDFPLKTIKSNSDLSSSNVEQVNSLTNPEGALMPFRHVTELEALVRKLALNETSDMDA